MNGVKQTAEEYYETLNRHPSSKHEVVKILNDYTRSLQERVEKKILEELKMHADLHSDMSSRTFLYKEICRRLKALNNKEE